MPGFPVMAWPMMEWALDTDCLHCFNRAPQQEHSIIVFGGLEASLTPLMQRIERAIRRFAYSVSRAWTTRSMAAILNWREGPAALVPAAWEDLRKDCTNLVRIVAPELVRSL